MANSLLFFGTYLWYFWRFFSRFDNFRSNGFLMLLQKNLVTLFLSSTQGSFTMFVGIHTTKLCLGVKSVVWLAEAGNFNWANLLKYQQISHKTSVTFPRLWSLCPNKNIFLFSWIEKSSEQNRKEKINNVDTRCRKMLVDTVSLL